ncbi:hypothetical protein CGRA01v4_04464 [Colletotrichum graminicola]|uniref:Uncharacterized protein n=1 Tax=Colletotrichum graminicola (strain M1.001 / M2 / FGSC 10212) TaxID=645133 RepID=E3Q8M5_COLGM|nr:uncharacterized protein GLRG_01884 [Colletotrichum graminicola M1.001]EFQ27389.1 hypothetical protein GLRG_01884 [Colletotrichum graminicola M1.001]WDK13183.1 hypothetical protein CGRA01v4_04464 [Colletotrichum graminicola]
MVLHEFVETVRWAFTNGSTDVGAFFYAVLFIVLFSVIALVVACCVSVAMGACVNRCTKNRDEEANKPDEEDGDDAAAGEMEENDD